MTSPIRAFRRFLRRLVKDQRGGEAIEMAVVGVPFIALVFGIIELGLVFMVSTTLENATDEVSRQIRTGQLQTSGGNAASLKTAICGQMSWLGSNCAANLNLDVRTFSSFAGQSAPPNPLASGTINPAKFCWDPGGSSSVVLVRAYYTWTLILPVLNSSLATVGQTGKRVIQTATTFRNEPYAASTPAPTTCPTP